MKAGGTLPYPFMDGRVRDTHPHAAHTSRPSWIHGWWWVPPMGIGWDALHAAPPLHFQYSGHCAQRHRGATETMILEWVAQMEGELRAVAPGGSAIDGNRGG